MTTGHRNAVIGTAALALAGVVVAVVALLTLRSTRHDLDTTRRQLAAVQTRLANVAAANTTRAGKEPALNALTDQVNQLFDEVQPVRNVCDQASVAAYYQRLLGAQAAGADVSVYLNLLDVICPDAVGDLKNDRSDLGSGNG